MFRGCCVRCQVGGSEAICIYLRVPDYAPFSWLAIRPDTYLSRRCFTLTLGRTSAFFVRDIISGSVTRRCRFVFFFFPFFFSIDNWTRDLSGRNDLGVLIERELFFLFSNVYDLTTRSRLGLNISIRCYIRRIIHSGKEFSWLVKREEQKTLSQRRVFNPPRIFPSMRISYRGEIRKKKDSCHHRHPVNKHGGSPGGIPVNQLHLHPSLPFQFSSLFTLHAINDIPATKP